MQLLIGSGMAISPVILKINGPTASDEGALIYCSKGSRICIAEQIVMPYKKRINKLDCVQYGRENIRHSNNVN